MISRDGVPPRLQSGGFTLVELVMVIAILAVLAGFVLVAGQWTGETGRIARAKAELASLEAALEAYKITYGDYPRTASGAMLLQSLIGKRGPRGAAIDGPCLIEMRQFFTTGHPDPFITETAQCSDPWGTPYRYAYKSTALWSQPGFVLYSCGPDGASAELLSGGRIDEAANENRDNVYANR